MFRIKDKPLEEHIALEINVDFITGKRAGDIDPRDPGLICLPLWQNFDLGKEMRLIIDERDPAQYEGVEGIVIHKGADMINTRVSELFKTRYDIASPELFMVSITQKRIDLSDLDPALEISEQLRIAQERGCLGIGKQDPELIG